MYLSMAGGAIASLPLLSGLGGAQQSSSRHAAEVGGGSAYTNTVGRSDADTVVSSAGALHDALRGSSSGDVVFVAGDFSVDASQTPFVVPSGVTMAGDRGVSGSSGATISTETEAVEPMVEMSSNSRVTGLQFDGPAPLEANGSPDDEDGSCITAGSGCEVDNVEAYGWSESAVRATSDAHVHHCDLHHNARWGTGYGVVVYDGNPLIEWNRFNYNRHSIACGGSSSTGYEACYNYFGSDTVEYIMGTHEPGGNRFHVHHNTFESPVRPTDNDEKTAIRIRGSPSDVYLVENNWFLRDMEPTQDEPYATSSQPIAQTDHGSSTFENVEWNNNHYGSSEPTANVGVPRSGSGGGGDDGGSDDGGSGDGGDDGSDDGGSGGDGELPHVLTITADGRVPYEFTVSGGLEKSGANGATTDASDGVSDSTATGQVWGGRDSYNFSGELTDFTKRGEAKITVDGEPMALETTEGEMHTLTVESEGPKVNYDLAVSGTLHKSGARNATFDRDDVIEGSSVSAQVWGGRDSYNFSGDLTGFTPDGSVRTYLDGTEVDPQTLG